MYVCIKYKELYLSRIYKTHKLYPTLMRKRAQWDRWVSRVEKLYLELMAREMDTSINVVRKMYGKALLKYLILHR